MPVTLTNLQTSGPLYVPLTSGVSLRLSPGATSEELPDVEVDGNPGIEKLTGRGLILLSPVERRRPAATPRKATAGTPGKAAPEQAPAAKKAAPKKAAGKTTPSRSVAAPSAAETTD